MANNLKVIYTDGIYDLFHVGHIKSLNYCKNMFDNVYLIVGVIDDKTATDYKRTPIYFDIGRYEIISNIKAINKIIKNAPLIITEEFIREHNIDYVVHGFSNQEDANKQDEFYKIPKLLNKFIEIPYTHSISTTDIMKKIQDNCIKLR